jgi:phosphotransferase system IIB component
MIVNETVEYYLQNLFNLEYLNQCFELRIHLVNENKINKSEFEKNESELLIYKTKTNLFNLNKKIEENTKEFNEILKIYFQQLEEIRTGEDESQDNSNLLNYE